MHRWLNKIFTEQPFSSLSFLFLFSCDVIHSNSLKHHLKSIRSWDWSLCRHLPLDLSNMNFHIVYKVALHYFPNSLYSWFFHFKTNEAVIQFRDQTRNLRFLWSLHCPPFPVLSLPCLYLTHFHPCPKLAGCLLNINLKFSDSPTPFLMMSHHHFPLFFYSPCCMM